MDFLDTLTNFNRPRPPPSKKTVVASNKKASSNNTDEVSTKKTNEVSIKKTDEVSNKKTTEVPKKTAADQTKKDKPKKKRLLEPVNDVETVEELKDEVNLLAKEKHAKKAKLSAALPPLPVLMPHNELHGTKTTEKQNVTEKQTGSKLDKPNSGSEPSFIMPHQIIASKPAGIVTEIFKTPEKKVPSVSEIGDNDKVVLETTKVKAKRAPRKQKKKQHEDESPNIETPLTSLNFAAPLSSVSFSDCSRSSSFANDDASDASLSESLSSAATKKPRKVSNQAKIPSSLTKSITECITRRQRHNVLELMTTSVDRYKKVVDPTFEFDATEIRSYMVRLENRVFNAVLLRALKPSFNLYRSNLYKKVTHELIWALRRNAKKLLVFDPDLLASLPAAELIKGSEVGVWYEKWIVRQEDIKRREEEMRASKRQIAPEGHHLRCPKCACLMDMNQLQTRSADEPMTIFKNCPNCGFTRRQ
jgi:hypothetical protein